MGGDGGSIPKRDDLVILKKKPEQIEKIAKLAAKWRHCAISQEALQRPIVCCELGRLYKKDKVLEFLLDRSKFESAANFQHIKGLKDMKELVLTENSAFDKNAAEKGGFVDRGIAEFMCPVTGLEMSGMYRFVAVWTCGCVFSERALKEVKSQQCHKCQRPFLPQDIVILNGTDVDMAQMKTNMEERRAKAKLEKKARKKNKNKESTEAASTQKNDGEPPPAKQAKTDDTTSSTKSEQNLLKSNDSKLANSIKSTTGTAATTETAKKLPSSKSTVGLGIVNRNKTDAKKSIQQDPNASSVFKSLFTTSEKAKNQPKGPWVTHDPRFN